MEDELSLRRGNLVEVLSTDSVSSRYDFLLLRYFGVSDCRGDSVKCLAYANVSVSTAISGLFESHTEQQNLLTALLLARGWKESTLFPDEGWRHY